MARWSIGRAPDALGDPGEPIVAELFSAERLEQHAESLAAAQTVTDEPGRGRPILPRLADNGHFLLEAYRTLAGSIRDERSITPAAEWLVDNFHIVEEQVREIRDDLPDTYYRELPKLADGPLAGYPRVIGLAWAYVAHTDSRFDPETLRRMVAAYQRVERDQPAHRPRREPAALDRADRPEPVGPRDGRPPGRPPARPRRPGTRRQGVGAAAAQRRPAPDRGPRAALPAAP